MTVNLNKNCHYSSPIITCYIESYQYQSYLITSFYKTRNIYTKYVVTKQVLTLGSLHGAICLYKARIFCTGMPHISAVTNFYCDLAFVELFLKLLPHKLYTISFICLCMCLDKVYSQGSAISAIHSKWELLIWYEFLRSINSSIFWLITRYLFINKPMYYRHKL